MKKIIISAQSLLLSEAIAFALKTQGQFVTKCLPNGKPEEIISACRAVNADILLMDVTYLKNSTIESRLEIFSELSSKLPDCKRVLLCDENIGSELAEQVKKLKQLGKIDAFFYESVNSSYLAAAIDSL